MSDDKDKTQSIPDPSKEPEFSDESLKIFKQETEIKEVPLEVTNKRLFWLGTGILGIIFSLTGWFGYQAYLIDKAPVKEVIQEVEIDDSSEAETKVDTSLSREEIWLEVLNGSGKTGEAGRVAGIFEDMGYLILGVGNADSVEGNQVYLKIEDEDNLEVLMGDLRIELEIEESSGETSESTASAVIILGK